VWRPVAAARRTDGAAAAGRRHPDHPGGGAAAHLGSDRSAGGGYQAGLRVTLRGPGIGRDGARVRFGDVETPAQIRDAATLSVRLSPSIPPGALFVSVAVPAAGPEQAEARSNALPFVVVPRISEPIAVDRGSWFGGTGARATIVVQPPVAAGQRPYLLLNETPSGTAEPRSYRLVHPTLTAAASQLRFGLRPIPPGQYLVRLEVGQATSRLTLGNDPAAPASNGFTGPLMVVP
jgi:hypothetical protein